MKCEGSTNFFTTDIHCNIDIKEYKDMSSWHVKKTARYFEAILRTKFFMVKYSYCSELRKKKTK